MQGKRSSRQNVHLRLVNAPLTHIERAEGTAREENEGRKGKRKKRKVQIWRKTMYHRKKNIWRRKSGPQERGHITERKMRL